MEYENQMTEQKYSGAIRPSAVDVIHRNALLVYLRDLRDLEMARIRIAEIADEEYAEAEEKVEELGVAELYEVPAPVDVSDAEAARNKSVAFTCVLFSMGLIFAIAEMIFLGVVSMVIAFFSIFFLVANASELSAKKREAHEVHSHRMKLLEHNRKEEERVKANAEQIRQISDDWDKRNEFLVSEDQKVEKMLEEAYAANILAAPYRNIESLIYIYDYMSTSHASLSETLFHEHMENGIQRLLERLDEMIEHMQEMVFSTRILEAQSQRLIDQNQDMLNSLERLADSGEATQRNTEETAQYARIGAGYNAANAYFSMANYLKKN